MATPTDILTFRNVGRNAIFSQTKLLPRPTDAAVEQIPLAKCGRKGAVGLPKFDYELQWSWLQEKLYWCRGFLLFGLRFLGFLAPKLLVQEFKRFTKCPFHFQEDIGPTSKILWQS